MGNGRSGPRVFVSLLDETQEFQRLQAQDARDAGGRLGFEVEVAFAQGHAVVQIQQLFKPIHATEAERPLALVVEPATGEGFERVARNAVSAGIGWVLINVRTAYLEELRRQHPGLPIGMVGGHQREIGRIQGRQAAALLGEGGRVLCVHGPADSSVTRERGDGLKETLGGRSELRVLNGDWTESGGERAIAAWLRLKTAEAFQPDVVACQNDAMAVGARAAFSKHRPDWRGLRFLGCDGLPQGGQKLVSEGRLAATVITPPNTGFALELLKGWLAEKKPLPAETLLRPQSFPPEAELGARR